MSVSHGGSARIDVLRAAAQMEPTSSRLQSPQNFIFELFCGDARVWVLTEICQPLVQYCLFLGGQIRAFEFNGATDELLTFCERQSWNLSQNLAQIHR